MADFGFFRPTLDALAEIASMDEPVEVRRDLLQGVFDQLAAGNYALAEHWPPAEALDAPIPLSAQERGQLALLRVLQRSGHWGEIIGS